MAGGHNPESTREAILEATYLAISKHGYPNLTIENIAEEFDKSKSLIYHHYEGKEAILIDFLDYLLGHFDADVVDQTIDNPDKRLLSIIDRSIPQDLAQSVPEDIEDDQLRLRQAFFEIRSQAPHNETFRNRIEHTDAILHDALADVIADGVESGVFKPVDPDTTATFIQSAMYGAMERDATVEDDTIVKQTRKELLAYIDNLIRQSQ